MTVQLEARNTNMADLARILKEQQAAKLDIVGPITGLRSRGGTFSVAGTSVFDDAGAEFTPTAIADGHLADKLGIPVKYLRRMRAERPDLYDENVNGWIHGLVSGAAEQEDGSIAPTYFAEPDKRTVMARCFQGDPGERGVLRAVLSDRYMIIENFDVLTAALAGIYETGTQVEVLGCDLTETRMRVNLAAPEIFRNSPQLLANYRSPFGGEGVYHHEGNSSGFYAPGQLPQALQDRYGVDSNGVCAGLVLTNGETGGSAFSLGPRFLLLACANGVMIEADAFERIHLAGKLEHGIVDWSTDTQQKALALVTAQARDAVKAFLDPEYVEKALSKIEAKASKRIENPAQVIEIVSKQLSFTDEQSEGVLAHFIAGGQVTAGGVMQAVTSFAQTVSNPDVAYDLELAAMKALDIAVAA